MSHDGSASEPQPLMAVADTDLMDIEQVCARVRMSPRTVERRRKCGQFPDGEMRGRRRLWHPLVVRRWEEMALAAQLAQLDAMALATPACASPAADPAKDSNGGAPIPPRARNQSVFSVEQLERAQVMATRSVSKRGVAGR